MRRWYNRTARRVGGDWTKLKDEFSLFFFPVSKVIPHRMQLLSFEQGNKSLVAMWARFMHMVHSGPPHNIEEEMLMQHFILGLVDSQFLHVLRQSGLTGRADRSDRSSPYSPSRVRVFVKSPFVILLVKGYVV